MSQALTAARVAIVSGKGGVGKTTVAAALAVAAARRGSRVLLAEVEERHGFAPMFGVREVGYDEKPLTDNIVGLSVQPDEALVDYLQYFYGIPKLSRALVHSRAIEFATNTAPGLRDILLIGKIKEAEQRRKEGRYVYDLIVLDAPPTGRLPRFLDAPRVIVELVHAGPIMTQAKGVLDMVLDPKRAHVVLVTNPEDMPVRETAEAAETLAKMNVSLGPVVVNGIWPEIKGLGKNAEQTLRAQAEKSQIALNDVALEQLAIVAAAQARRARNQRAAIKTLAGELDAPLVKLPYLFTEGIGAPEIERLASHLEESGSL